MCGCQRWLILFAISYTFIWSLSCCNTIWKYFHHCSSVFQRQKKCQQSFRLVLSISREFFQRALKLFQEQNIFCIFSFFFFNNFYLLLKSFCSHHNDLFMMKIVFSHNFPHIEYIGHDARNKYYRYTKSSKQK